MVALLEDIPTGDVGRRATPDEVIPGPGITSDAFNAMVEAEERIDDDSDDQSEEAPRSRGLRGAFRGGTPRGGGALQAGRQRGQVAAATRTCHLDTVQFENRVLRLKLQILQRQQQMFPAQ
eukprot:GHVU01227961.1.p1 GENE.GHVU01227961.1~~GHVU01227961.1.p1  ORF type:complete len:121 (+),score=15.46 GHVU01227961.1:162-524(+)